MANKTKKISATAFTKAVNENYSPTTTVVWNGLNIVVKKVLSMTEVSAFVNGVVSACFAEQDNSFTPEFKDLAINAIVIELYTNIDMPSDIAEKYELSYKSGIMPIIMQNIDLWQYDQIMSAIDEKIDSINQINASMIDKRMNELCNAFDEMQSNLSTLYEGIKPEDIKNVMSAISNSTIDENKLMKAYINNKE